MATPKPREITGWIIRPSAERSERRAGPTSRESWTGPNQLRLALVFNLDYMTAISNANIARGLPESRTERARTADDHPNGRVKSRY